MKCYYHETADVTGQCPSCSKFLCKTCLDEYGTGFCKDCTAKKYRKFCDDFKDKLKLKIKFQHEKIKLVKGVVKKAIIRMILHYLILFPFQLLAIAWVIITVATLLTKLQIKSELLATILLLIGILFMIIFPIYALVARIIAESGAQLHRELKEKERTERTIKDFGPEMQAIFTELRLVATSVSPFGRDQIYEEPGESNVWFARLKRNVIVRRFSLFTAPVIWKKIKEAKQKLIEDLAKLEKMEAPPFEKFVSIQRTLLVDEEHKPSIPNFNQITNTEE